MEVEFVRKRWIWWWAHNFGDVFVVGWRCLMDLRRGWANSREGWLEGPHGML
ncbi:uncharacterized protein HKW66_Vig0074460 [Vigna angularis]|uniref:Uncharacterized protein n=1 Tax=Phaseolus angularis TaxID=3914 RepID=A0A8T0K6Q0_PHAAN|nr:uncharacterized protein HKW66_Vig0074460 [Vigna angularis]